MPRKVEPPFRMAPLQRVIAQPITDPAERAALDKVREREKGKKPQGEKSRGTKAGSNSAKKSGSRD